MLQYLLNVFLQASTGEEFDLSWIAILIAGISAAGVTGSFLLSWYGSKRLADQKITEMTIKYNQELSDLAGKLGNSKTGEEFDLFFNRYINKLDELASLNIRGFISDHVCDVFYLFLKDGNDSIEWLEKNATLPHSFREGAEDLLDWYKEHKKTSKKERIPVAVEALQKIIRNNNSKKQD